MGKRYIDSGTRCPHYHSEDAQKIYCDGVGDESWIHHAFQDKAVKKQYKRTFCRGCWRECVIAMALEIKKEDDEK